MNIQLEFISLNFLGYGNYSININGVVKNIKRNFILINNLNKGYYRVRLYESNKSKYFFLHRLLALTFLPNPENKPCINHKNGIKIDNRIENLEWCTVKENNIHAYSVLNSVNRRNKISLFHRIRLSNPKNNPMWNKKHFNLSRERMKTNHANFKNGNHPLAKKVICFETGEIFDCAKNASLHIGLNTKAVTNAILKKCKAGGFSWGFIK